MVPSTRDDGEISLYYLKIFFPGFSLGEIVKQKDSFHRKIYGAHYPVVCRRGAMNWKDPDRILPVSGPGEVAPQFIVIGMISDAREIMGGEDCTVLCRHCKFRIEESCTTIYTDVIEPRRW
jgi:hypothetical protein